MTMPRVMARMIATTKRKMTIALKVPFESARTTTEPSSVCPGGSVAAVKVEVLATSVSGNSDSGSIGMHLRFEG